MHITINQHPVKITKKDTHIYGLEYTPQMADFDNDEDYAPFSKKCSVEVSAQSFELVATVIKNYMSDGIIEIGVSRNGNNSFTQALLQNKPDHIPYLGIDIEDKSHLNNKEKNIFTLKENSFNQVEVRKHLNSLGFDKISILFIDGWHSVNACINDWMYTDLLSDNAIVILHDTNYHPGPAVLIEVIDKSKFKVVKHFQNEDDYGVAIIYKL